MLYCYLNMQLFVFPLTKNQLTKIKEEYGIYAKITADIEIGKIVVGCELHADGEDLLLKEGSKQTNIWGGGINFLTKAVDTTAVLNIRPGLNNDSLEILDPSRREKFISLVKTFFEEIWEQ